MVPVLIAARVVSNISLRFGAPGSFLPKYSSVAAESNYVQEAFHDRDSR